LRVHVIIPFKGLSESKSRLASGIPDEIRKRLVKAMLSDVISAVVSSRKVSHIIVVTSDETIKSIIPKNATLLLEDKPGGINQAINEATEHSIRMNAEATLIVPADVPLITPQDIDAIISAGESKPAVIISPSSTGGTNLLYRAPPKVIKPRFGRNSFQAHLKESRRMKVEPKIYRSSTVSLDVDEIDDAKRVLQYGSHTKTFEVLSKLMLSSLKG